MPELKSFPVYSDQGYIGSLQASSRFLDDRKEKTIKLEDGRELTVPAKCLTVQADGSFFLRHETAVNGAPEPVVSEAVIHDEPVVRENEHALFRMGYVIEHVPIERVIDQPVAQRQEGDTLVLPVVEEVLVYEKKLLLKEEIRITPRREAVSGAHAPSGVLSRSA